MLDISTNPTELLLCQYRKQRGVNLGSWFVLERWITDHPFRSAQAPAQSDLDVARGSNAKEILEEHWDNFIVEQDWAWIAERGMNAVRLPIGYYHLCGVDPSVLVGTPFQDFEFVFSGAWTRIVKAIESAGRYGLGVLIDLHAAPGKQNRDSHAGTSDPPKFFSDKRYRSHTIDVLCTLLKALVSHAESRSPPLTNLLGIELLNEPQPGTDYDLQTWYTSAIRHLRAIDPSIPLYLSECWRTHEYTSFVEKLSASLKQSLIVLDHHLYRCFTPEDIATPAREHARRLADPSSDTPRTLGQASERLGSHMGGLIVGEWSGALNPGSLTGAPEEQKEYVQAQLQLYERSCAGWFFWTYKKQQAGDTGWSLRDAVGGGVFPEWVGMRRTREVVRDEERRAKVRDEERDEALAQHTQYWSQYGGKYEHWRFGEGFVKGWDAGYIFLDSNQDDPYGRVMELGFKGAWARRVARNYGKLYWEYEHGFIQGADTAKRDYLQSYCS
ncbi:putative glycosyl hydrolase 5 (cellulase A) family protein [Lyophyllum shimeji]|uniref:Glycosyl hydrolase 5 (Cellulase A) family protein n=1 Tax=Lyophyllum shimeji TaxID=47721 RepID=A0A9P3UUG9_LYOSH|nr:putative glycosyl hydrolase 5 (cellulase A) family protein [Lyophyllum shimeji]